MESNIMILLDGIRSYLLSRLLLSFKSTNIIIINLSHLRLYLLFLVILVVVSAFIEWYYNFNEGQHHHVDGKRTRHLFFSILIILSLVLEQ